MAEIYHISRRESITSKATDDSEDLFEDAQETLDSPGLPPLGDIPGSSTVTRKDSYQGIPYLPEFDWNIQFSTTTAVEADIEHRHVPIVDPHPAVNYSYPLLNPIPQVDESQPNICAICSRNQDIWFCNVCAIDFCDRCWGTQIVHIRRRDGVPHEKTNPSIAAIVRNALSQVDDGARERLHRVDASTAWFGVERPDDNSPAMFRDYGRFTELMTATSPVKKNLGPQEQWAEVDRDNRTPSLVSFVGQTGAGKSTLVKLLIDFAVAAWSNEHFATPVIGPREGHLPTSDDVHLYLDPSTADSAGPLLYADCEGLEGGEREPLAAMFKRKRRAENNTASNTNPDLPRPTIVSKRELLWANEPYSRSREFAVTNLYPRLLYTFSDVIVFVLRNPRVIEHVFERLVQWAAAAIETSSNQPVLPHAIIALNASENGLSDNAWDVRYNTETILNDLAHTVNKNETFKKWAQFWRVRGKIIDRLDDLLLCYYSSIQIIRLPTEGRPNLMEAQIRNLYDSTLTACIAARCARYQARMLLDAGELHDYLQEAFNHYSNTLDSPFDFVQASSRNSSIPADFGGNILKLALDMMNVMRPEKRMDKRRIFSELSYMVASCIMLESARHKVKGSASKVFPKYINHLDDALGSFCHQHWPCEFEDPKTKVRCVNVRNGHSKGHQSEDGKVFATGEWVSDFSFDNHGTLFRDWVYCCLVELLQELAVRAENDAEEQAAAHIHKTMVLGNVFAHIKHSDSGAKAHSYMVSHTSCFCCLFGQAEHFLPCGHVLCSVCVRTYGNSRGSNRFEICECPFEHVTVKGNYSWTIHLIPKSAGIRIITLDGGGIRGIVELEVLQKIQTALGGVPIQCFIDLIVGTSTGGLVALGLGSMNWSVEECIDQFEGLCYEAFTRRTGSALPVVGHLIDNYHHSKYQTSTLEKAFMSAFTEDIYLFGGPRLDQSTGSPVKVAVTAASLDGTKAYVISNYNRRHQNNKPTSYQFQRPESDSAELKKSFAIWRVQNEACLASVH